jgi:hypothetical protein
MAPIDYDDKSSDEWISISDKTTNDMAVDSGVLDVRLEDEEEEGPWELVDEKDMENTKIKLDVGGKLFATTRNTLLKKERSSYFCSMLLGGQHQPDKDGKFSIS